ncbi:uncharacterized protein PV06_10438 [Exophiala oligosperma]|uniref:Uncharacterized protein n=1 Tax=Exophiala oligosperma TaxID=215243 RepID=A0A0D2D4Y7_9EURO|nr:uncharacterized protein PV06_10438 [Exophiala oligosperma]KIW37395.1 hypothetical protein PV06_10438 [Exophiala oligosperma]
MPSSQDSDRPLAAFGIRDLNGPEAPPGVVQILKKDYTSTVQNYPEAVLSYVDYDDGEIITVGSSLELQQRLEEPARHSTLPVIPALRTPDESTDNKMMHIFDIKKTGASLAVWKEHEAYTSKAIREKTTPHILRDVSPSRGESANSPPLAATQEKVQQTEKIDESDRSAYNLEGDAVVAEPAANEITITPNLASASPKKIPPTPINNDIPTNLDKAFIGIFSAIESRLGPLADFLETTAGGLRKVADKTAKSDSSAVEDVLSGFKDILTQVGEFGLGVAATIGEEIEKNKAERQPTSLQRDADKTPPQADDDEGAQPEQTKANGKSDVFGKRVSFDAPLTRPAVPKDIPLPEFSETSLSELKKELSKVSFPELNRLHLKNMFMRYGDRLGCAPHPQNTQVHPAQQPHKATARHSILDMESTDPDFSARYPPLLSLRKAMSVNELQKTAQATSPSHSNPVTGPAAVRYPSLRQFEQQAHTLASNKTPVALSSARPRDITPWEDELKSRKTSSYRKPSVEEDDCAVEPEPSTVKPGPSSSRPTMPSAGLPGAWPETKTAEDMSALPANKPLLNGGSVRLPETNIFSKPPANLTDSSRPLFRPYPDSTSRPPMSFGSEALKKNLRRYHTVSAGINPAARLNGPFDPLAAHPPMQPRSQKSQPDLQNSYRNSEDTLSHKPSLPNLLPQRSQTVNYTDRYVPRYVTPSVFMNRARDYAESRSNARDHRIEGHHIPGPGWGVRYFSPFGQPATSAASSAQTSTATTVEERPSPNTPAKPVFAGRPTSNPPYSFVPPVQGATTKPAGRRISTPAPALPTGIKAINDCVNTLIDMGFGANANEMTRLNAVASATAGNLEEAIDMLEEDREATEKLGYASDAATNGSYQDDRDDMYN